MNYAGQRCHDRGRVEVFWRLSRAEGYFLRRGAGDMSGADRPQRRGQDHAASHSGRAFKSGAGARSDFGKDGRAGPPGGHRACWAMASAFTKNFPRLRICGCSASSTAWRNAPHVATEWLERTGLDRVRDGLVREFSRGMRQRLAIARAFCTIRRCCCWMNRLPRSTIAPSRCCRTCSKPLWREGGTIIMSTHQLREALELATDVALINRGKLAFRGPRTREMLEDPGWLYRHYGEA